MSSRFRQVLEYGMAVRAIGLTLVVSSVLAIGSPRSALGEEDLAEWAEGPVQWLLLPDERREIKKIASSAEASGFVDAFWARRAEVATRSGEDYRVEFVERVEAADILYSDEGIRGSLTDRGRALILLGPPVHVTVTSEPVLAWDPSNAADDRVTMRDAKVEIWGYRMEDLPPGMLDLMLRRKKKAAGETLPLTLMFRTVGRRTSLVEGETLLQVATKAAAAEIE